MRKSLGDSLGRASPASQEIMNWASSFVILARDARVG